MRAERVAIAQPAAAATIAATQTFAMYSRADR